MKILQTRSFTKTVHKLHKNQKQDLDLAIKEIIEHPKLGGEKTGDLKGIRVYKFRMINQLTLLAYEHSDSRDTITLLALGTHENFYRDLKNQN